LKPDFQTAQQDAADRSDWSGFGEAFHEGDPDGAKYRHRLAVVLGDLACEVDSAPQVARGLLHQYDRFSGLGDELDAVRNRMNEGRQNPERCPGVAGFTEDDWHRLGAIEPVEPTLLPFWREPTSKGEYP
jgi:hypothetical protein